jgi:DNA-binding transcriptional LysR family regulator
LSAKVACVDLDLSQVRAFVAAAGQLHFGRAAAQLFLTQQALSKRISRLERALGEQLFVRGTRGVELSDAGRRFLPHARQLLAAADAAAFAAHPESWPLRIDVWGQVQAPLRMVRRLLSTTPGLAIEPSMRRSLPAALEAIGRGEIDACFGRPHDLAHPWPNGLSRRPVLLERLTVAVGAGHPLADAAALTAADLAGSAFSLPASGTSAELYGWARRFADDFGLPLDASGHNLGQEHALDQLKADPRRFILIGTDWPVPAGAGVRLIPLTPVPCFLWSLIWPEDNQHPLLAQLVELAAKAAHTEGWLAYDPHHDWLPGTDRTDLPDT